MAKFHTYEVEATFLHVNCKTRVEYGNVATSQLLRTAFNFHEKVMISTASDNVFSRDEYDSTGWNKTKSDILESLIYNLNNYTKLLSFVNRNENPITKYIKYDKFSQHAVLFDIRVIDHLNRRAINRFEESARQRIEHRGKKGKHN